MKKLKVILSLVVIIFCMMLLCSCDGIRSVNGKKFCYQNNEMITGWYKMNNGEYYYFCEDEKEIDNRKFEKGEMLNGVVTEIDGVLYAFDKSGPMCKGKWITYENNSMYADQDGHIVKNETREIDGSRYEFDYKGVAKLIPNYNTTSSPNYYETMTTQVVETTIVPNIENANTKKTQNQSELNLTISYLSNFWIAGVVEDNITIESLIYERVKHSKTYDLNFVMKGVINTPISSSGGSFDYLVKDDEGYVIKNGSSMISFVGMQRYDKFKHEFQISDLEPGTYNIEILGRGSLNKNWENNDYQETHRVTMH